MKRLNYLNREKVETALGCEGFGNHGLGATGRAIHQNTSGSFDAESDECFGVFQGPLDRLLQLQNQVFLSTNISPLHLRI
jgi:hypothetical protein